MMSFLKDWLVDDTLLPRASASSRRYFCEARKLATAHRSRSCCSFWNSGDLHKASTSSFSTCFHKSSYAFESRKSWMVRRRSSLDKVAAAATGPRLLLTLGAGKGFKTFFRKPALSKRKLYSCRWRNVSHAACQTQKFCISDPWLPCGPAYCFSKNATGGSELESIGYPAGMRTPNISIQLRPREGNPTRFTLCQTNMG